MKPSARPTLGTPKIGIVLEERFKRLSCGRVFSPSGFGSAFWERYSKVFGPVRVIARTEQCNTPDSSWSEVPTHFLKPIHPFVGPTGFMQAMPQVVRSFDIATQDLDGLIVRAPGTLALLAARRIRNGSLPFAVELVGDPMDVFGTGIAGWLGPFLQRLFTRNTRWLCANAGAVSYVTRETLQRRYPPAASALTVSCSSVELPDECFSDGPRNNAVHSSGPQSFKLVCAASLEVPYKGVDVLIKAMALLNDAQRPQLIIAGDGRLRTELESLSVSLGLDNRIRFMGQLERNAVIAEMRQCDLYVQPSLTEGLPRAIIEAMATAAPVIGSGVGGIPELLESADMVQPGNPVALASLIGAVLADPARRTSMSRRNYSLAKQFSADLLNQRRSAFYRQFYSNCLLEKHRGTSNLHPEGEQYDA